MQIPTGAFAPLSELAGGDQADIGSQMLGKSQLPHARPCKNCNDYENTASMGSSVLEFGGEGSFVFLSKPKQLIEKQRLWISRDAFVISKQAVAVNFSLMLQYGVNRTANCRDYLHAFHALEYSLSATREREFNTRAHWITQQIRTKPIGRASVLDSVL